MRFLRLLPVAAIGLWMAGTLPALAQVVRPEMALAQPQGLTAVGHAELKFKPDVAYITVGVVTQARDQAEAVKANATRATAVLNALKQAGVADKDIQTQFYGVQPQYDYQAQPAVLTGYQVTNSVQVTVRDLTKPGQIIDKVSAAGANQVNGVSFDLSDRSKAQSQALSAAVANAKAKVATIAQAAGVSVGRLISMTEGTVAPVQPVFRAAMMRTAAAAQETTPVEEQQITITADVTAVYAIGLP
ncbi:MAG: SIMPL domain-containing protein [Armatimonadota bacterium]|nr:SIMPL domain-containing protein [Armatimonadota bacterium]